MRPISHPAHQSGAYRILVHIDSFLNSALETADAMVKRSCLPPIFGILEHSSESAFPARNPIIEGYRFHAGLGEEMQMVA
jgi:hypothetical protein